MDPDQSAAKGAASDQGFKVWSAFEICIRGNKQTAFLGQNILTE